MARCCAPCDHVKLGSLLSDNKVVHVLTKVLLIDIQTGLYRINHFTAGQSSNHVTVMQIELSASGVLVSVNLNQFPVVVIDPVVLLQGLFDGDYFQPFCRVIDVAAGDGGQSVGAAKRVGTTGEATCFPFALLAIGDRALRCSGWSGDAVRSRASSRLRRDWQRPNRYWSRSTPPPAPARRGPWPAEER